MSTDYWEQRYKTSDMPWEKGAPSPGLVDFLSTHHHLTRTAVAVPGCGTGHDAIEFARNGFDTYGFDLSPSAIRLSRERAEVAGLKVTFEQHDFLRDEPVQLFDWVFEHTLYCAIDPGERDLYVQALLRWLKPGGNYLAVNYLIPNTDGPPFGTTRDEILERFSPHFDLQEELVPRSFPNRQGLELLLWWRRR